MLDLSSSVLQNRVYDRTAFPLQTCLKWDKTYAAAANTVYRFAKRGQEKLRSIICAHFYTGSRLKHFFNCGAK